jgi:protein-S-isoprenylcysteine O-methyltransferase Ste14
MSTWIFRHRFAFFAVGYCVGFALYGVDHVPVVVAIFRWVAPSLDLDAPAGRAALRAAYSFAALAVVSCAALRTWAAAYLQSEVVHDVHVHSDALVADGPYRYVRNPLYLGALLLALGFGLAASRSGFVVIVGMTSFVVWALIRTEEHALSAEHSASYAAYVRAVPRLIPAFRPRVPPAGTQPRWAQSFVGESFMWIFAAASIALAVTLRGGPMLWVASGGLVVHLVQAGMAALRRRR